MRITRLVILTLISAVLMLISGCASPDGLTGSSGTNAIQPTGKPNQETPQQPVASVTNDSVQPSLLSEATKAAAAGPPADFEDEGWRSLFNGTDLSGWTEANFGGGGKIESGDGVFVMGMGEPFTGLRYTNEFPKSTYEIALDAMRLMGSDFFCALTVPVSNSFCSLIVGGWGGSLVGISSLNGLDASENETTKFLNFEKGRWYRVRMRVTPKRLEAWIDKDKVVDVVISEKLVTLRPGEIEECKPLGLATWQTAAAIREIRFRTVDGPADPPPKSAY